MKSCARLLAELLALPSVNPAFLPAGDARAGEGRVADFLASAAGQVGLAVEFQEVFPGRANLLARLIPAGKITGRILLAPHLDTVGSAEMPEAHFQPRIKSGRLYGRGACDTKGSVAAMFTALGRIARGGRRPAGTEIIFAGLADEENAQAGSRALVKAKFKADLAIVGEPTELKVITAHKGDLWLKLITLGKAAHGSRPELGENAVHAMARVIDALETQYQARLRKRWHPLLGPATVNVGAVRGGTQPNIVPDRCEIEIDRRTIPGERDGAVRREILNFLAAEGHEAQMENFKTAVCAPLETDPELPLVRELMGRAGQRKPLGADFFCDAAVLAAGGIPSVVFGPGSIAQAHTADEWIALDSLERAADLLEGFLRAQP